MCDDNGLVKDSTQTKNDYIFASVMAEKENAVINGMRRLERLPKGQIVQ